MLRLYFQRGQDCVTKCSCPIRWNALLGILPPPLNVLCYNLCTTMDLPRNFHSLLGMSLTFCPRPHSTNESVLTDCQLRFRWDMSLKIFFAGSNRNFDKKRFVKSSWEPPPAKIPGEIKTRITNFLILLILYFTAVLSHQTFSFTSISYFNCSAIMRN